MQQKGIALHSLPECVCGCVCGCGVGVCVCVSSIIFRVSHRLMYYVFIEVNFELENATNIFKANNEKKNVQLLFNNKCP